MAETRQYQSPLRESQAEDTRARILEGLIGVIVSDGVGELSVPAVAKRAGVSVPTIYRHFGSKQGLVQALGEYVVARSGLGWEGLETPRSADELADLVADLHRRSARMEPALRAAMATDVGQHARRALMPRRLKAIEDMLGQVVGGVRGEDLERLRDVVLILGSSAVMRAFKDYLDIDAEQTADTVSWAVRLLLVSVPRD